jgi:transposase-like protein
VEDANVRATIATDLFGRAGLEILPMLEAGEAAMVSQAQAIRDAGVASNEWAAASEDLVDQIALAGRTFTNMRQEALAPMIPALSGVIQATRETLQQFRETDALDEFGDFAVGVLLDIVAPAVAHMANATIKAFGSINPAIKGTIAILQALRAEFLFATGQWDEAREVLQEGRKVWREAAQGVRDLGRTQAEADTALQSFLEKLETLRSNLDKTPAKARNLASGIREVKTAATEAASAVGEMDTSWTDWANEIIGDDDGINLNVKVDTDAQSWTDWANEIIGDDDGINLAEFEKWEGAVEDATDNVKSSLEGVEDSFSSFKDTWSEGLGGLVNEIGALALDIIAIFQDMNREVMRDRIASYEETSREIEDINQKLVDTVDAAEKKRLVAEKARLQEEAEAQKEAALEAFHTQKALAIAAASINTALAVINAFATAPNIVMGAVMAVIAGAAGAVSIATIAAEQPPSFHSGGVLRASDLQGATMDSMMIRAKPGEGVLSTAGVAAAGGAEGVDALNAGRTMGRGTTVNVIRFGTRTTEAISHQQLQSRTGKLQGAFRSVRPKVGRSIPGRR